MGTREMTVKSVKLKICNKCPPFQIPYLHFLCSQIQPLASLAYVYSCLHIDTFFLFTAEFSGINLLILLSVLKSILIQKIVSGYKIPYLHRKQFRPVKSKPKKHLYFLITILILDIFFTKSFSFKFYINYQIYL